jgi:hypothetical protein
MQGMISRGLDRPWDLGIMLAQEVAAVAKQIQIAMCVKSDEYRTRHVPAV